MTYNSAPTDADAKPWWQSRTIWGSVIAAGSTAAALFGHPVAPDLQSSVVELATGAGGVLGLGLTVFGRLKAGRPIG
jgi:hypothetical protein